MQFPVKNNLHSSISSFALGALAPGDRALAVLRELKEPAVLGVDVVPDVDVIDREQIPGLAVRDRGTAFFGMSIL